MKRSSMKYRQLFHHHPVSSTLLAFYLFTSLLQGNMGLFLAGLLAAAGAFGLETIFHVTGAIGTRRSRAVLSAGRDVHGRESRLQTTGNPGIGGLCPAAGTIEPGDLSGARLITIRRRA